MRLGLFVGLIGILFLPLSALGQVQPYPVPLFLGDPATRGLGIQRAMKMMAGSTPQHRNTVRVLFYGQSITEQPWWLAVSEDLKRRFPFTNFILENRALGGFSSQRLVKTAETDIYPFYPDLMVFHVYGDHRKYEDIIRRTRSRTTSEVLIQTDHLVLDDELAEETDPSRLQANGKMWSQFMNYVWLPTVAKKYGTGLLEQRDIWKQYLRTNKIPAKQLLTDDIHPNAFGSYLMAEIVKADFVYRNEGPSDPMNCDFVRTYSIGKDLTWKDGKLKLDFTGNRVDLLANVAMAKAIQVKIDGKAPSEIPSLYRFTRALSTPGGKWPVLLQIRSEKPLLVEDWTLSAVKDPQNDKVFSFTVTGSKTGYDGSGRSDQQFVSKTGRIVIDPSDWDVEYPLSLAGIKTIPRGLTLKWKVVPFFKDEVSFPSIPDPTVETVVTVAQGLQNSHHTLELVGGSESMVGAVRVYKPQVLDLEDQFKQFFGF